MKVKFPAMQAKIGQRTYYACVMKLSTIPVMFTFTDWSEITPEDREQRVLNKNRIPDITSYIVDNEDGYLFASITASYKCPVQFEPVNADGLGYLEMNLASARFVINDGQHRCAAIHEALKLNPDLGDDSISVLLFEYESRERVQQMFTDLNRNAVKPNNATNIAIDPRDRQAKVTREICERVLAFQGLVDKEHQSLPAHSEKAFTLYSLYDATKELLADKTDDGNADFEELVVTAVDYWTSVANFMPDWLRVKDRKIRPVELRQENISTHSVVLRALGGVGSEMMRRYPADWKDRLAGLRAIDWSKRNRDWENVCMVANSVIANRQARLATKAYLKRKLGVPVSDAEQKSIAHLTARNEAVANLPVQEAPTSNGSRKEAKKIRIEIHWSPDNKEIICQPKASESFVRFLTRLYEVKGGDALAKLSASKFSRGILLSKTPHVDFSYTRSDGRKAEYSNQPIANSGYHLLTHGETWQKTADIAGICRVLGLPTGMVKVEEIEKSDPFKEFVV